MKAAIRTITALLTLAILTFGHAEPVKIFDLTDSDLAVLSKAKIVAFACTLYAVDHDQRFPKNLEELFGEYVATAFDTPGKTPGEPARKISYEYFAGTMTELPEHILFFTKSSERIWIVVFSDATFKFMNELPNVKTTQ